MMSIYAKVDKCYIFLSVGNIRVTWSLWKILERESHQAWDGAASVRLTVKQLMGWISTRKRGNTKRCVWI